MPVYLDYNATALPRPQVIEKIQDIISKPYNPSSVHCFGREAKKYLENSRKIIAEYLSAWTNEVIFTASGTEANVTVLHSFPERRIFVSEIEHSSVLRSVGDNFSGYIPVNEEGIVNISMLEEMLRQNAKPTLISVMLANNETGVIQPVKEISEICKKYDALLHCDAVQALGKIDIDFSLLGADFLSVSAHKCGGVVGAAALIVKNNVAIKPLITGGGQELGRRAGTENIAAIIGFSEAVERIDIKQMQNLRLLLDKMEERIIKEGGVVFGKDSPRLPNTSCIAMPKVSNEVQLMDFDLNGYAVSAGSACSSGRVEKSHVLLAMNIPAEIAECAIRVSAGWNTGADEIEKFTESWALLAARLRK